MNKKIVVHNGRFHADELVAVAIISIVFKGEVEVIRTRDEAIISSADFVIDVGGSHDESKNIFDHHQAGGAGVRVNNVPYASCGLVWKKYGAELCGSLEVAERIDKKLMQPIDLADNGVAGHKTLFEEIHPYTIQDIINSYLPTWKENDVTMDERFSVALEFMRELLKREIKKQNAIYEGEVFVKKSYDDASDKRVIVLDNFYNYQKVVHDFPEPLYVIYPTPDGLAWHVSAVKAGLDGFENRKDFPESWAGKRDAEFAELTGVPDAIFCHNKRFLAVAKSKEGAMKLAQIAVM